MKKNAGVKLLVLIAAILVAMPSVGFAGIVDDNGGTATTPVLITGGLLVDGSDVNFAEDTNVSGTLTVAPFNNSSTVSTPGVPTGGLIVPWIVDNGDGTSTVYNVTDTGFVDTTTNTIGGGAVIEASGDVTLSGSTESVDTKSYDWASSKIIDNATLVDLSPTNYEIEGTYDAVTGAFIPGAIIEIGVPAQGTGGDLSVARDAVIMGATTLYDAAGSLATANAGQSILDNAAANVATQADVDANEVASDAADAAIQADVNANEVASNAADFAIRDEFAAADTAIRTDFAAADANLQKQIDDTDDRLDQVGAMSAAFSAMVPNDRASGNAQIALGLGNYSGETAVAAGLFYYINDSLLVNAGGSFSTDEAASRAGITFGF